MKDVDMPIPEIPITIKVVLSRTVHIPAVDYDTALEEVKRMFRDEEIVLDYDEDYCYDEIE